MVFASLAQNQILQFHLYFLLSRWFYFYRSICEFYKSRLGTYLLPIQNKQSNILQRPNFPLLIDIPHSPAIHLILSHLLLEIHRYRRILPQKHVGIVPMFIRAIFMHKDQPLLFVRCCNFIHVSQIINSAGEVLSEKDLEMHALRQQFYVEVGYRPSMPEIKLAARHRI